MVVDTVDTLDMIVAIVAVWEIHDFDWELYEEEDTPRTMAYAVNCVLEVTSGVEHDPGGDAESRAEVVVASHDCYAAARAVVRFC